jgi:CheY-like chemotaxis protein
MAAPVLIVEDNLDLALTLAMYLELRGHEVAVARDGAEGLAFLRDRPLPSLIVLDLLMPVLDGWGLRREQLRDPRLAAVPVLVCSGAPGWRAPPDGDALLDGCVAVLHKPVEPEVVAGVARRFS